MNRSTIAALAGALMSVAPAVQAAEYPTKAVRMVIAFSPGGPSDILSRLIGGKLGERMGHPFVFDNRPGAGGNVSGEIVATSPADGYTLMIANNSILAANATLYSKMTYNPAKDLVPVTWVASQPNSVVVHPTIPAKSVKELIDYLKTQPGKLNFASSGSGAAAHLAGELFKSMTKTDMVHVPYKGAGPALVDVIAGQVQLIITSPIAAGPHIGSGKVRALATTGAARNPALPDLPTVAATLPGYEITQWWGLSLPAKTPRALSERLQAEAVKAVNLPEVRERIIRTGAEPVGGTAQAFDALIHAEQQRLGNVIRKAGITLED